MALKISNEEFNERFEREARAVAALNHPNICTLHDVGPNYLVMELVEGPTLADRIKAGTDSVGGGIAHRPPDRGRIGGGARKGHRSSRPETRQHQDQARRHGEGAGFRVGKAAGRGLAPGTKPERFADDEHGRDPAWE